MSAAACECRGRQRQREDGTTVTETDSADSPAAQQVTAENVATRAELLPEELTVGSDDPRAQAEAILLESEERTDDPDAGI
jgi:hypothetical protein